MAPLVGESDCLSLAKLFFLTPWCWTLYNLLVLLLPRASAFRDVALCMHGDLFTGVCCPLLNAILTLKQNLMGIKKGENWGFCFYLQASRNEMLPGQTKAFGVGALLCRNDI